MTLNILKPKLVIVNDKLFDNLAYDKKVKEVRIRAEHLKYLSY